MIGKVLRIIVNRIMREWIKDRYRYMDRKVVIRWVMYLDGDIVVGI